MADGGDPRRAAMPGVGPEDAPRRVLLDLRRDVGLWQAAFWPERFAEGSARLGAALGLPLPPPGRSAPGPRGRLLRAQPLVWHLLDPPAEPDGGPPQALRGVEPAAGAVAELGPGLARVVVHGPGAAALLARAITLDLRPSAFPPGAAAATGWGGAPLTVLRPETGGFALLVPRSGAEALLAALRRRLPAEG